MTAIVVGILPQDRIRERMLAISRGEYKPELLREAGRVCEGGGLVPPAPVALS
jgi:hypothetical protein